MARKKKDETVDNLGWDKAKWVGFSNIPVHDSDLADIERWGSTADMDALMEQLVSDGYRVTIGLTDGGQTVQVGISAHYKRTGQNAGLFMSSYASSIQLALWVAFYKHYVIAGDDAWPAPNQTRLGNIG